MNEIDQQISKLESELQKLKQLREKEKEPKVKLFDGVSTVFFDNLAEKIEKNAKKTCPQAGFCVRCVGDWENDGIYLGNALNDCSWEIVKERGGYVLKLKEKDSSETFEYKGYVWKKWSGKECRPPDIQFNDVVYYVKKSEFDKNVYSHAPCRADWVIWENVVGYFKKV
jgi:hypothetical protein